MPTRATTVQAESFKSTRVTTATAAKKWLITATVTTAITTTNSNVTTIPTSQAKAVNKTATARKVSLMENVPEMRLTATLILLSAAIDSNKKKMSH